jgi:uncharacterized YigZ family protein
VLFFYLLYKFLRFLFRSSTAQVTDKTSEEEAQEFIQKIKKQHWNATHNCSAYLIGETDHIQKANDDGEPSGTAGVPVLEVLKKRGLKDTCAVVTRYFGGIKLGAGGLIRAYGKSVSEGLNHIGVTERKLMRIMHTSADYTWLGKIENELREIRQFSLCILTLAVRQFCHPFDKRFFVFFFNVRFKFDMIRIMDILTNGKSKNTEGELTYLETDVSPKGD